MRERFKLPLEPSHYVRLLTAAYMAECQLRETKYDGSAQPYIEQAASILTGDSSKFGIIMFGTCGNGKTTLMRAIQNSLAFLRNKGFVSKDKQLTIITAREYAKMVNENKDYNDKNNELLGIDDLGIEPTEILHYGNVSNPVIECLEHRYNKRLYTFITTNLKPDEIRQKYGDRIADRMNEMFNRIIFQNGTHRI